MIWAKSEQGQPVAPGPPGKRMTPVSTWPGMNRQIAPGVRPGLCSRGPRTEDDAVGEVVVDGTVPQR